MISYEFWAFLAVAYLMGSFPSSYVLGKILKNVDIRKVGSGNVGATNAFRVLGPRIGVSVMIIDILKGFLPVWAAHGREFGDRSETMLIVIGLAAIIGHVFTIFLNFRGGKGVATTAGVFLALAPQAALVCIVIWVALVAVFKMASVASIAAAVALPVAVARFNSGATVLLYVSAVSAILVILMHRKNIGNLLAGRELKINSRPSGGEKEK